MNTRKTSTRPNEVKSIQRRRRRRRGGKNKHNKCLTFVITFFFSTLSSSMLLLILLCYQQSSTSARLKCDHLNYMTFVHKYFFSECLIKWLLNTEKKTCIFTAPFDNDETHIEPMTKKKNCRKANGKSFINN